MASNPLAPTRAPRRRTVASFVGAALIVGLPALAGAPAAAAPAPAAVSAPTVAAMPSAYQLGDRILHFGKRGADVKALQKMIGVRQTTRFNRGTRRAVKRLERAAGLRVNGIVTPKNLEPFRRELRRQREASRSLPEAGGPRASKRYAKAYIARKYNWGASQNACLVTLWERESGWRYWVSNPNGIYRGIPQTSSAVWGPMGYTTRQYMNSPEIQIKVGSKYIKDRYGNPCRALSFWNGHHWY